MADPHPDEPDESQRRVGAVLVQKANKALLASAWKKRTLVLTGAELSYGGKRGSPPTAIDLRTVRDARLVSRHGEFVVVACGTTDDGETTQYHFRAPKNSMREATLWVRHIKLKAARAQMLPDTSSAENSRDAAKDASKKAASAAEEEEWPDEDDEEDAPSSPPAPKRTRREDDSSDDDDAPPPPPARRDDKPTTSEAAPPPILLDDEFPEEEDVRAAVIEDEDATIKKKTTAAASAKTEKPPPGQRPRRQRKKRRSWMSSIQQPTRWAQVDAKSWWEEDASEDLAVASDQPSVTGLDPLGLVSDDVVAGVSGVASVSDPDFDAEAFLLAIHGDASFAALRHGRANLRRSLGAHDHKLQMLVRDNLHSFLNATDHVHRLTVAFDRLLNKAPRFIKMTTNSEEEEDHDDDRDNDDDDQAAAAAPGGGTPRVSTDTGALRLAQRADRAVHDRFDPVLLLIDRATALQTTTNLLVLFAPLTDADHRSEDARRRWADALRTAATWDGV